MTASDGTRVDVEPSEVDELWIVDPLDGTINYANGIPYYVHNRGYGGLYPGMQLDLLNVRTIMVPPSAAEAASELLALRRSKAQRHPVGAAGDGREVRRQRSRCGRQQLFLRPWIAQV